MVRMVWVDNAKILAIFSVIFVHIATNVVIGVDNFNSSQWWIGNIYDALNRWPISVFIMLSGALLLSDGRAESIYVFYKKRAAKVLIPILFWSLFFLAWTYLKGMVKGNPPSLLSLAQSLLLGMPYYHMWFLYMIIGLYFVTPFIRILVRNTSKSELLFFVIVSLLMAAINKLYGSLYDKNVVLFINWFILYLPYFILGHLITISVFEPNKKIVLLIFTLSVLLTALGCFLLGKSNGLEKGVYFYHRLSITGIPMSISIMFLLKKMTTPILINVKVTSRFASLVLGIYLVHPVIIDVLKYYDIYALRFNVLISVPLISILVFITSAMLAWFISMTPYLKRII